MNDEWEEKSKISERRYEELFKLIKEWSILNGYSTPNDAIPYVSAVFFKLFIVSEFDKETMKCILDEMYNKYCQLKDEQDNER